MIYLTVTSSRWKAAVLVQWMHHAKQLVVFYYTSFLLAQDDIETCWSQSVVLWISRIVITLFSSLVKPVLVSSRPFPSPFPKGYRLIRFDCAYFSFFYFFRLKTIRTALVWTLWRYDKFRQVLRREDEARANHPRWRSREDRLSRVSIAFRTRALQKRGYKALCWSGY